MNSIRLMRIGKLLKELEGEIDRLVEEDTTNSNFHFGPSADGIHHFDGGKVHQGGREIDPDTARPIPSPPSTFSPNISIKSASTASSEDRGDTTSAQDPSMHFVDRGMPDGPPGVAVE